MFKLDPSADTIGVTGMGEIEVPPALLVKRFGSPGSGDGFKTSGEYVFVDLDGRPFIVHDWKATSLWDSEFPTPEEYWASRVPEELTISTRDLATHDFQEWLLAQLRKTP